MKDYTIIVPNSDSKLSWFAFVGKLRSIKFDDVENLILDLNTISFLRPFKIVLLGSVIEHIYLNNENIKVNFIRGSNGLNYHLENIKFKDYWNKGFNRDRYTEAKNSTTLCLWHISKEMIDGYGMQTQAYFKRCIKGKDLQPLSANLIEIFNNIFDHSRSEINGYVITQYFPNIERLNFAVCDFGIGIPSTINNYLQGKNEAVLPDHMAIEQSLIRGVTVRSTKNNAGFGLANVSEFAEDSNGTFNVFSNNGYYIKETGVKALKGIIKTPFNGTLVEVDIDTKTFEDYSQDEYEYGF